MGEKVTSTYADLYNVYEKNIAPAKSIIKKKGIEDSQEDNKHQQHETEWISPSDTLIGIIELQPPFTSKLIRGKTHEGILAIGNKQLQIEFEKFNRYVANLINDNNSIWLYILDHETEIVKNQVKEIYNKLFLDKSKIMAREINEFYKISLQALENHLRSEVKHVYISAHANLVTNMKSEIKTKVRKAGELLEAMLKSKYLKEIKKIKTYYKILFEDQKHKNDDLIFSFVTTKNDALRAFYHQIEATNLTSTMYVMCRERNRCRIKKLLLEKYHSNELDEKLKELNRKQDFLKFIKKGEESINEVNQRWEERIKKILALFLKFISFSLKLLPEQAAFLIDFRKLVVLQLNEIKKLFNEAPNILIDFEDMDNTYKFPDNNTSVTECTNVPFVIEGDLTDTPPRIFGSTETLPSDVDLPFIVCNRKYIYAKCHKFEELKEFVDSQQCRCQELLKEEEIKIEEIKSTPKLEIIEETEQKSSTSNSTESLEHLLIDDFETFKECPVRKCQNWIKAKPFPDLESYLDFSEENFNRINFKYEYPSKSDSKIVFEADEIANLKPLFYETSEIFHNVATQCEEENEQAPICPCMKNTNQNRNTNTLHTQVSEAFLKRKTSLKTLMRQNPNLLKMFIEDAYDFSL